MPNAGDSFGERVAKAKQNYVDLDKKAQEVEVLIFSVEAELVAVQKYYHDAQDRKIPPEQYEASVKELGQLVAGLRTELAAIRAETSLAMDEAGISDDLAREEAGMRKQLDQAVRAEHEAMQRIVGRMGGGDRTKADQIGSLLGRGAAIDATVDRTNLKIDRILDQQLAEIKVAVVEERTRLAEYRTTLEAYEVENVEVGSTVIAGSFDGVVKKFYDIGVRADLGVVDVAWAQNEEAKDRVNRLNLDSSREKKVLLEEFREILAEDPADAPPAPAPEPTPTPAPEADDDGQ